MMILLFVRNVIDWLQTTAEWGFFKLKYTVTRLVIIIALFIVLLWLAVFLYGSFYYVYMPTVSHVKPVHLQFRVCETGLGMCSFPTANITLTKEGKDELFMRGQPYKLILDLELPESKPNKGIGMFMVNISLYDKVGTSLKTVARSSMLHYRSDLLHTLNTLVFSPFLLIGHMEQTQKISVELFSHYLDDAYNPAVGAVIEIQSRKIEVYSSMLRIHAHFSGLRYIMFNWPTLSAVFGVFTNLVFLSFIALLSWYRFLWNNKKEEVVQLDFQPRLPIETRRRNMQAVLDREREAQSGGASGESQDTSGRTYTYPSVGTETVRSAEDPLDTSGDDLFDSRGTIVLAENTDSLIKDNDSDTRLRLRHPVSSNVQRQEDQSL